MSGRRGLHATRSVDLDFNTGREIATTQSQKEKEKIAAILVNYRKPKLARSKSVQVSQPFK